MTDTEKNELRLKYFQMIIRAYQTGDASPLFPYIADDCHWYGKRCGADVIESLKDINVSYRHGSCLVELDPMPGPLTGTDGAGRRVSMSLWYEPGEICMHDITYDSVYLYRMELNEEGKIQSVYATMPDLFDYHPVFP